MKPITNISTTISTGISLLTLLPLAQAADYQAPKSTVVPSENASAEALNLSSQQSSLRFGGLDLFPHVAGTVLYDDNLLIGSDAEVEVTKMTLSPGLTIAAGDISTAFPGSITLAQIRDLLNFSLVEDTAKPQRFLGIDYTPDLNLYVDNEQYNNADHIAGMTAGYAFSKLVLGLDQDFRREAVKSSIVGSLVTIRDYQTHLRTRYEFNETTSVEVNGTYQNFSYEDSDLQGYQEFRNDDWLNRRMGDKLTLGVGAAFGFLFPSDSDDQTYQQLLGRAVYRLSGKISLSAAVGAELREYEADHDDTVHPTFDVRGIYQPWASTTFTIEGLRREQPSPFGEANYTTYGVYLGARQLLFNRLYAGLNVGYNNVEYTTLAPGAGSEHTDNFYFARVRFDYALNPHWMASVFYTFTENRADPSAFSYDNNILGAHLAWQF